MANELDLGVIPPKLAPLFDESLKYRYYAIHGGRYSTKSWTVAKRLISKSIASNRRVLCCREIQRTIKDSVHKLLSDTIKSLRVEKFFDVTENTIRCVNGSEFVFRGLKTDPAGLKSLEGITDVWCEEAESISDESWENLIPTIRTDGAVFYIVWNDKTMFDPVYVRFVETKRDDVCEIKINYVDIPKKWIPKAIWEEIRFDRDGTDPALERQSNDPAKYLHVWLGDPTGYAGRIYPMYKEDIHYIDFPLQLLSQCNCYMAIDPHVKYFPAIKWYAVTPTNSVVVYNEYPKHEDLNMYYDEARHDYPFDKTMKELANIILANDYSVQYGAKIKWRTYDPRFASPDSPGDLPEFFRLLMQNGVGGWIESPYDRISVGRDELRRMMSYNPALPLIGINMPIWYVRKGCKNTSRMYLRHSWDEEKDKEAEEHKDFCDCDRYFIGAFRDKIHFIPEVSPYSADHLLNPTEQRMGAMVAKNTTGM